jgi:hypothetical protein
MGHYEAGYAVGRTRDRKAARTFLNEEAYSQHQKEGMTARAIEAALEENKRLVTARFDIERQILIQSGLYDDTFTIPYSAVALGAGMGENEIKESNIAEAGKFVRSTPEYYSTPENAELIIRYLGANNVRVANFDCYQTAFQRLTELGMLQQKPVVKLEPEKPKYSEEELNVMTADQYAVAVGLKRVRPEEVRPVRTGKVTADEALEDLPNETAEQYRTRLARSGISTRVPVRAPW